MFDTSTLGTLRREVRSHELILTLRRRIGWVIFSAVLAFAVIFWYAGKYFVHESRVIVDVSPAPVFLTMQESNRQQIDLFRSSEYVMRVLQFTHSDKMSEHLIRKFDLYKHYGIDPAVPYADERMRKIVASKILVKKSLFDNVVITVRDRDRLLAAAMANEIAVETDVLARTYLTQVLTGKRIYFEELHRNLVEDFSHRVQQTDSALKSLAALKQGASTMENRLKITGLENALLSNASQMNVLIEKTSEMRNTHTWMMTMLNSPDIRFITVTQQATVDQSNFLLKRFFLGLGAFACVCFSSVLVIYFVKAYGRYFQLFFSRGAA